MKILRKILLPFSVLYALILRLRNFAYDQNWLPSTSFQFPIICVGNLSLGGTGKSPAIEYLIRLLGENYKIATLSRGYGRKTTGFLKVEKNNLALEVGDEPLQFKNKYPEVEVAVDEKRVRGIQHLLNNKDTDVILLDDAFQHRKVKAGFHILLSVYGDLYINDFVLPAGNLREPVSGAQRADIIIITKCPEDLSVEEQERIQKKLKLQKHQKLFFAYIAYKENLISTEKKKKLSELKSYTLVTGIANPKPLLKFLKTVNPPEKHLAFKDHHNFTAEEIKALHQEELILTTEKDFTRLKTQLPNHKLFYIPIEMKILNHAQAFDEAVLEYVSNAS
ncbi:tetraacyldisaccharide 4'-kinase [Psychroflexus planctonicus]|uniref:Tetraacyldisaccharide 4'-kinase n=1 Tax=Psychroflexus planctonicus TaxID=1526575 RepID=A0ABQ1SCN2_9FLAO|nr:tetraacyldisaccharide 4'-kinase [Psychroflexus planctonicus]GGE28492.1 tetraacyldisaccharide 4'-kinase [Psychroflexus planctonicus]